MTPELIKTEAEHEAELAYAARLWNYSFLKKKE